MRSKLMTFDPWLEPFSSALAQRTAHVDAQRQRILRDTSLPDFALGYLYFGLHQTADGWVLREWAPNASIIYIIGEFSGWQDDEKYKLIRLDYGNWEVHLPADALAHLDRYKLHVFWDDGDGYRLPSYATRIIQNGETKLFDAQVWQPANEYEWHDTTFTTPSNAPYIYEAHVGMSGEDAKVTSYTEFTATTLPRIIAGGYNVIQLMAIQEHPYYGSFGYHVSNYFAPSSRFGTPDDLKALIDAAHQAGIAVIIDLVHSHAVKNEEEGLSRFDGSYNQYFHDGERGHHVAWDSRVFDYGKPEVVHFLLSNCRYWLDEYHVDGYRFDGVTSMLYTHHGLARDFTGYDDYFDSSTDLDAVSYLTMANELIHAVKPYAITIAEEMSGMPGLGAAVADGGIGFDYRLSMGVPDLWIKLIKEQPDEQWDVGTLFHELSQHRSEEKTISYAESHDQALVGDKTLIFRLIDKAMYDHMQIDDDNLEVSRGIALHKMICLLTASMNNGGYLAFMGNEFGHPEWIDFPREGNDWSYQYARRQWHLVDDMDLKYHWLGDFDKAMIALLHNATLSPAEWITINTDDQVLAYIRGDLLFVFNFNPSQSFAGYGVIAPVGHYRMTLSTDDEQFGGFNRIDTGMTYQTHATKPGGNPQLELYLPARSAFVLRLQ